MRGRGPWISHLAMAFGAASLIAALPTTTRAQVIGPRAPLFDSDAAFTDSGLLDVALRSDDGLTLLGFSAFISSIAEVRFEDPIGDESGVDQAARFALYGWLSDDFSYQLSAELVDPDAPVRDARITYEPADWLRFHVGRFKVPFSRERRTPVADTDLIRRSRVVQLLAPDRGIGLELGGRVPPVRFVWRGGVFASEPGEPKEVLAAGRFGTRLALEGARFELAASALHGDGNIAGSPLTPGADRFTGQRSLAGADARITWGPALLSAEGIVARIEPDEGGVSYPWGHHITAGAFVTRGLQLLLRWDSLRGAGIAADRDVLVPSAFFAPYPDLPVGTQVEVEVDLRSAANTVAQANVFIAF